MKSDNLRMPRVRDARLNFGNLALGNVYGGPYAHWREVRAARPLLRINMAGEVRQPSDLTVPTVDFGRLTRRRTT